MMRPWLLVAAALMLSSCSPKFAVGQQVCAKWLNAWYLAEITKVHGSRFDVRYADDDTGTLTAADMRPLLGKGDLRKGEEVFAAPASSIVLFPATVAEVRAAGVVVDWEDGRAATEVPYGRLAARWSGDDVKP